MHFNLYQFWLPVFYGKVKLNKNVLVNIIRVYNNQKFSICMWLYIHMELFHQLLSMTAVSFFLTTENWERHFRMWEIKHPLSSSAIPQEKHYHLMDGSPCQQCTPLGSFFPNHQGVIFHFQLQKRKYTTFPQPPSITYLVSDLMDVS